MKSKLLRAIAVVALGVSLSVGMAAAQTGTLDTTGPNSTNKIMFENDMDVDVRNDTDVDVDVDNDQDADSGHAKVHSNTNAGDAESGEATNDQTTSLSAVIDNSSANHAALSMGGNGSDHSASIDTTGPNSNNHVIFNNSMEVDVTNDTNLDVDVDNDQDANSGNAEVSNNTNGGSATSGSASNTSSTTVELHVSN